MPIPRWTLTGNVHQTLDATLTPSTRVRIRVRTNVDGYVDQDGDDVILGQRIVTPASDGSYEIPNLLDHDASGGVQYAFDFDYIEDLVGPPVGGMPMWSTKTLEWFSFDANRSIGELVTEQYIPAEAQTAFREEILALVAQAEAAAEGASAGASDSAVAGYLGAGPLTKVALAQELQTPGTPAWGAMLVLNKLRATQYSAVFNILDFGAKCDAAKLTGASMTAGSGVLDDAVYTFTADDVGKSAGVENAGYFSPDFNVNANDGVLLGTILGVSGGNALLSLPVGAATLSGSADTVTRNGHGLTNNTPVNFTSVTGTSGISAGVNYYVAAATTNTFKLAAIPSGPTLDMAGDGTADLARGVVAINTVANAMAVFGTPDDQAIKDAQDAAVAARSLIAGSGAVFFPAKGTIVTKPRYAEDFVVWTGAGRDNAWVYVLQDSGALEGSANTSWLHCSGRTDVNPLTGAAFHDFGIEARFHIRSGGYDPSIKALNIFNVRRVAAWNMNVRNTGGTSIPFDHQYERVDILACDIFNPGRLYTDDTRGGGSGIGVGTKNDGGSEPGLIAFNNIKGVGDGVTPARGNNAIFLEAQGSSTTPAQPAVGFRVIANYMAGMRTGFCDAGARGTVVSLSTIERCEFSIALKNTPVRGSFPGLDTLVTTNTLRNAVSRPTTLGYGLALSGSADTVTKTAHGLANGALVRFASIVNTTGIVDTATYFASSVTADTFKVAATPGGAAIDLVGDGTASVGVVGSTLHDGRHVHITGDKDHGTSVRAQFLGNDMLDAAGQIIHIEAGFDSYGLVGIALALSGSADTVTKTAHGLANGAVVNFSAIAGVTGVVNSTDYYVVSATANTFKVSASPGGSAIDLVGDGTANVTAAGQRHSIDHLIFSGNKCHGAGRSGMYFGINPGSKESVAIYRAVAVNNDFIDYGREGVVNDTQMINIYAELQHPTLMDNRGTGPNGLRLGGTGKLTGGGMITRNDFPDVQTSAGVVDPSVRIYENLGWPTREAASLVRLHVADIFPVSGTTVTSATSGRKPAVAFPKGSPSTTVAALSVVDLASDCATFWISLRVGAVIGSPQIVAWRPDIQFMAEGDQVITTSPSSGTVFGAAISNGIRLVAIHAAPITVPAGATSVAINIARAGGAGADTLNADALVYEVVLTRAS